MITINQIENDKGRNDQFLPLFKEMKARNMGKLVDDEYFIVDCNILVNPDNVMLQTFSMIQQKIKSLGFDYSMYKLN
jgi:hypothetical protein